MPTRFHPVSTFVSPCNFTETTLLSIMAGNQPSERYAACQVLRPANVVEQ
eukprot:gene22819-9234_t